MALSRLSGLLGLVALCVGSLASLAQLTCEGATPVGLGTTPVATVPSFGDFAIPRPDCITSGLRVHHAIYLRFVAPHDGWYTAFAVPASTPQLWRPRLVAVPGCSGSGPADYDVYSARSWVSDSGDGCGAMREVGRALFRLQAGESRILVVGGVQAGEAGHAAVRILHMGQTQSSGAQELSLGSNAYFIGPLEPSVRISGEPCWQVASASRFRFVPPSTGTYRISLCNSSRDNAFISTDPDMQSSTLSNAWCNDAQLLA
jgi:hypothetical protein